METYHAFKNTKFTKVRRAWLGLLNVVMLMGVSLDLGYRTSARARIEKTQAFYERAVSLCRTESLRGASLDLVQYLLLASQYLQGTEKSSQTWTLHGLAVKGALALGLHTTQASQRFTALENEIRKRTWYGCILLDRVLSMTFGRPPCIPEDFIRLPLAQPWPENGKAKFLNPTLQRPAMDFFNASITLHRLIGRTVSLLYGQNLGFDETTLETDLVSLVVELEKDLNRWRSSLPADMMIVSSTTIPTPASLRDRHMVRLRMMLTVRYHNVRILVHRPLLCRSLDSLSQSTAEPWFTSISPNALDDLGACLASAEETIDLIMVIGTSSRVYPAAGYVDEARYKGARVCVINMDVNDKPKGGWAQGDWFFQGDAALIVPELLKPIVGEIKAKV